RKELGFLVVALLVFALEWMKEELISGDRRFPERRVHPQEGLLVVGLVEGALGMSAAVFADGAADFLVKGMDAARRGKGTVEVTEEHRVHVLEGPFEAPDGVRLGEGMLIDAV